MIYETVWPLLALIILSFLHRRATQNGKRAPSKWDMQYIFMGKSTSKYTRETNDRLTDLTPLCSVRARNPLLQKLQFVIRPPPSPCRHNGRHFSVIPEASPTLLNSLPALWSQLPKHVRYKPIHFVTRAHYIPCWKLIIPSLTLVKIIGRIVG